MLSATTVIVLVTDDGIFIGADSKVTPIYIGGSDHDELVRIQKVFALKDRFLIATASLAHSNLDLRVFDPRTGELEPSKFTYDSAESIAAIDELLTVQSSFSDLIAAIESVATGPLRTYSFFIKLPKERQFNPVGVWVAGTFDHGIPVVSAVGYSVDWERGFLKPAEIIPWHPSFGNSFGIRRGFYAVGLSDAVAEVEKARQSGISDTDGFRYCMSHAFWPCYHFTTDSYLPAQEAVTLLRTLLRLQATRTPIEVGPPYCIFLLRREGGIDRFEFQD